MTADNRFLEWWRGAGQGSQYRPSTVDVATAALAAWNEQEKRVQELTKIAQAAIDAIQDDFL